MHGHRNPTHGARARLVDRTKIAVELISIPPRHCLVNLKDFEFASRREFSDKAEAIAYARQLAKANGLLLIDDDEMYYLD